MIKELIKSIVMKRKNMGMMKFYLSRKDIEDFKKDNITEKDIVSAIKECRFIAYEQFFYDEQENLDKVSGYIDYNYKE